MFTKYLQKIEKKAARLLVFLIPTQLALHFWPESAFVFGIRVDYLSPAIYLTDILIALVLFLWLLNDKKAILTFIKNNWLVIAGFVFFAFINTALSTSPGVSLLKWLKISEAAAFAFYFYFRKKFLGRTLLFKSLFLSSIVFSVLGIAQFFLGRTTGLFYFLGERSFNISTPGIALIQIAGQDFLRAYSTLPHPNALSGYLGVVLLLFMKPEVFIDRRLWYFGIFIISVCMVLSFSLTGIVALAFAMMVYTAGKKKKSVLGTLKVFVWTSVLFSLFLPFVSNQKTIRETLSKNLAERLDLSYISGRMISNNFLFGQGLNTFIVNIPSFNAATPSPWLLQPVHNIYLLVFSETGIIGLLIFLWGITSLLSKLIKRGSLIYISIFIFVLFTGTMDHYWLTIQQNLLLLSFVLGLV